MSWNMFYPACMFPPKQPDWLLIKWVLGRDGFWCKLWNICRLGARCCFTIPCPSSFVEKSAALALTKERTKVGVDRFFSDHHLSSCPHHLCLCLCLWPPSIILSSFSSLLHPTLKLKDQETSCVGCIKTEVSGTFSLHCICLSPADAYSMKKELQQTFRIQSVWCTALANSSLSKPNFCKRKVRITFTNTTGWSMIQRWTFFSRASSQAALMRPLKLTA